jgi:hypothetical protein
VSSDRDYRCLACLEGVLTRTFDVSHISTTCPACGEFGRLVNGAVYDQFEAFEESPPEGLDWDRLDRTEKLFVSERVTRAGHSVEDFDIDDRES